MATYLVTGVAGFIASKVAEQLLAAGHTVIGVDNLNDYYDVRLKDYRLSQLLGEPFRPGADSNLSAFKAQTTALTRGRFTFYALDIENLAALDAVFAAHPFAAVLNLAARAGVRYSMENPYVYLSTNTLGTLNVLECMRKHGVKKQVLASTSSLYAGCPMPFNEEQPVNTPLSPYAATKKAAEMMSFTYFKLFQISTTVLRYFTVYGPAGRPDMAPFRFIKWVGEGNPIALYGDGSQSRDFTYVDDIANGTVLSLRVPGFEVINLGGGKTPMTVLKLIENIERLIGKRAIVAVHPSNVADMAETSADISKAKALLNWEPSTSVEMGLRFATEWYFQNRGFVGQIQV